MIKNNLVVTLFLLLQLTFWGQTNESLTGATVFINEIHYDNAGADINEGIELAGTVGTSLEGWSLALYNGNNGGVYNTVALSETFTDQTNGYGFVSVNISGIQNGAPDGIALVNSNDEVVQFLSYEGVLTAIDGPASGLTSDDIGEVETNTTLETQSLQLVGTGSVFTDFTWASPTTSTFGAINNGQSFGGAIVVGEENNEEEENEIPNTITLIHDIQGCLLYTSPSPRDKRQSRMPSSA